MRGALTLGVNAVNPGLYGVAPPQLRAAERDAWEVADFLRAKDFNIQSGGPVLGDRATRDLLLHNLAHAARTYSSPGDVFVLFFAGHGSQVPDPSWSERDGKNETWCLYDGEIIDHALYIALAEFQPGVEVLVIADCCHSGAADVWESPRVLPPTGAPARGFSPTTALEAYRALASSCDLQPRLRPGERQQILRANVELIAACGESELAFEGPRLGWFTDALLQVWEKQPMLPFADLAHEVNLRTPRVQTPFCSPLSLSWANGRMPF